MNATFTKMFNRRNEPVYFVRYQMSEHRYYFHKVPTEREAIKDCNLLNSL